MSETITLIPNAHDQTMIELAVVKGSKTSVYAMMDIYWLSDLVEKDITDRLQEGRPVEVRIVEVFP